MSNRDGSADSKIQEHVARTVVCRRCETEFDSQDVYILGQRDNYWCIAVSCPRCMHQGVLFLQTPDGTVPESSNEITDQEWAKFEDMPPISKTDVDSLRSALHELRKDISELWKE